MFCAAHGNDLQVRKGKPTSTSSLSKCNQSTEVWRKSLLDRHCLEQCSAARYYLSWFSWYARLNLYWGYRLLWLSNGVHRAGGRASERSAKQKDFRSPDFHTNINYTSGKFIWSSVQEKIRLYRRQGKRGAWEEKEIPLMLAILALQWFLNNWKVYWILMLSMWNSIYLDFPKHLNMPSQCGRPPRVAFSLP